MLLLWIKRYSARDSHGTGPTFTGSYTESVGLQRARNKYMMCCESLISTGSSKVGKIVAPIDNFLNWSRYMLIYD